MNGYWEWGIDTVIWLQTNAAFLAPLMRALSFLGTTEFLLLLGLTVYWCIDEVTGVRLGLLLVTGAALGGILKLAFHMPRPYWFDARVQPLADESTYGMPSIHALFAWAIGPWMGGRLQRGWGIALGILLALGISVSRVFLGVHFPGDVAAGFAIGVFVWFGVDLGIRFIGPILKRGGFYTQCMTSGIVSGALLLFQSTIFHGLSSLADPAVWAENAARINIIFPRDSTPFISLAGLILGMGIGLASKNRWAPFRATGTLKKRVQRFLFGFFGTLVLWGGLAVLWHASDPMTDVILRYLRYGLVGLWTVFLAPWFFLRWKLADRSA